MEQKDFEIDKLLQFWIESSDEDFDTMMTLFKNKKYSWSLFIGHLMVEKLLKALFLKKINDFPPFIHNLFRLAELCGVKMTEEQKVFLVTITAFNINARYDDYKKSFKQKCTPQFTSQWIDNLTYIRQWIKQLINQ